VGCRARADRSALLRVVAAEVDGFWSVVPDPRRRLPGRGAWLHPATACLELAYRRRAFARALRRSEPLDLEPVRELLATSSTSSSTVPPNRRTGSGSEADERPMSTQQ
jgi:predicted RNA-binding protein YlxR (DUF448 family)